MPKEREVYKIAIFGDLTPVQRELKIANLLVRATERVASAAMQAVDIKRRETTAKVKTTELTGKAKLKAVEAAAKATKMKVATYSQVALQTVNMVVSTASGIMEIMGVQLDAQFQCMLDVLVAGLTAAGSVAAMYLSTGPTSPLFYIGLASLAVSTALQITGAVAVMQSRQYAQLLQASAIAGLIMAGDQIGAVEMYIGMM